MLDLKGHSIILGSASPRRKELLSSLEIPFTVDTGNNFVESFPADTPYDKVPLMMSEGKSLGFHRPLLDGEILITSDTMVILPPSADRPGEILGKPTGEILGKPKGREDAIRMLRDLSGREHHVTTAVTIRTVGQMTSFTDTTEVWFKELSDDEIEYYVDNFRPFDKAGAYAIQEWIGAVGIIRIDGSYSNVMGLPVHLVYERLKAIL